MRIALLSILTLCMSCVCFSQTDSLPVYKRFPYVPEFTINKAPDSTQFTRNDLQRKPAIFIVFSPDCEHCQHETKDLLANIEKFKKTHIIMVTYLPYEEMMRFYKDYKIADYPMITMGRDAKFFFPVFFSVKNFPSIFVYDKDGKLRDSFEGTVAIDKIADAL